MSQVTEERGRTDARRLRAVLVGLVLCVSLAALDMAIVATAVRTIADDLGDASLQAWATTAYLIAAAVATPLYGRLSDLHGRRRLLIVAVGLFVLGSAACAAAGSMHQLAVFRALQGLGAGGLFSLSVTVVGDLAGPRERARHLGLLIAVYGVFGVLGPVAGGFFAGTPELLGLTGWRWVFAINVPVGLVALAVIVAVLPRGGPVPGSPGRVDWAGAGALALGVVPLLVVAEEGRRWGWTEPASLGCVGLGLAGLAAFVVVERRRGADALLPLRLFRIPTFRLGVLATFVLGFGMFGALTALPLYLQVVRGETPTAAGLLMLPLVGGIMVATAVSGRVIGRTGRLRGWLVGGSTAMIIGLFWLSTLGPDTPFGVTAVCMAMFGVGLGASLQTGTLALQDALPAAQVGVATSTGAFARQLGGSTGAAVFLAILFGIVADRVAAAFRLAAATPEFRALLADPAVLAEPANRELAASLADPDGAGARLLEDSSFLGRLHPELARPILDGFSASLSVVFVAGALVLVAGLAAVLALDDTTLGGDRTH